MTYENDNTIRSVTYSVRDMVGSEQGQVDVMSKYVNVEDVLEHAQVNCEDAGFIMKLTDYLLDDAEDIVHCKDCIYLKELGGHANCMGYLLCRKHNHWTDENQYCAWGERA